MFINILFFLFLNKLKTMMKRITIFFMLFLYSVSNCQLNPTLGMGLETLTFNKGTIDVQVLTAIIMEKQKELKKEALKRFMFKMFPDTNYTTRFYVQNSLNILLNEKNPQVIEKEILELTTNYAIALGVTKFYISSGNTVSKVNLETISENKRTAQTVASKVENTNSKWVKFLKANNNGGKNETSSATEVVSFDYKHFDLLFSNGNNKLNDMGFYYKKFERLNKKFNQSLTDKKYYRARRELKNRDKQLDIIKTIAHKYNIKNTVENDNPTNTTDVILNFGQSLDLVSLALSQNEELKKKGFFKNKIDYREEQPFFINKVEDEKRVKDISSKITSYVDNYDIIKTFLSEVRVGKGANINEVLTKNYLEQLDTNEINNFIKKHENSLSKNTMYDFEKLRLLLSIKKDIQILESFNLIAVDNESITLEQAKSLKGKIIADDINLGKIIKDIDTNIASYNNIFSTETKLNKNETVLEKMHVNLQIIPTNDSKSDIDNIKTWEKEIAAFGKTEESGNLQRIQLNQKKIDSTNGKMFKITAETASFIKSRKKNKETIYNNLKVSIIIIDKEITETNKNIAKTNVFFNLYINDLITKIENAEVSISNEKDTDKEVKENLIKTIPVLYEKLQSLKRDKDYSLSDISFLENIVLKEIILLKTLNKEKNSTYYDNLIVGLKNLAPLLKIKLLTKKELPIKYDENFLSLFEFIGNLGKLDKAETYSSVIDLIRDNSSEVIDELPSGMFKDSYKIFINGVKKYTLINAKQEYVEVDVVSFLNDLQQYYDRNNPSKFSLYLTLGLNQNFFLKKFQFPNDENAEMEGRAPEEISTIGFASEKLGIKFKILDFKRFRGYENVIKSDVYLNKRAPFFNEWYVSLYGSGLLYSLANTSTNRNFNFAHIGLATGLRFYNSLDFNVLIGVPFVKNTKFGYGTFIGLGLDIPLGEYLEKLGRK